MQTAFTLKIADTLIRLQSAYRFSGWNKEEKSHGSDKAFQRFLYTGKRRPHIRIVIHVAHRLPVDAKSLQLFCSFHDSKPRESWRLLQRKSGYLYLETDDGREHAMFINKKFDRVTAYLRAQPGKEDSWHFQEIVFNFLQILLINYFALRKNGLILHAVAVKDADKRGYLFIGKSGAGKTTTAKLWHAHSRAGILNDDRVIVRKVKGRFYIFGSPWNGEFPETALVPCESALLRQIFFIYHHPRNEASPLSKSESFAALYPNMFPAFWRKDLLERSISFAEEVARRAVCLNVGFVNNRDFIPFIRKLSREVPPSP